MDPWRALKTWQKSAVAVVAGLAVVGVVSLVKYVQSLIRGGTVGI